MSIVKMSRITVVGLSEDKSDVIESLMNLGAVELDVEQELPDPEEEVEQVLEDSVATSAHPGWIEAQMGFYDDSQNQLDSEERLYSNTLDIMSRLALAIEQCKTWLAETGSDKKISVDDDTFLLAARREKQIMTALENFEQTRVHLEELKNKKSHELLRLEILLPWRGLDIDLSIEGTTSTRIFLGSLDTYEQVEQLSAELDRDAPENHIEMLRQDDAHVLLALAVWRPKEDIAQSALRRLGFRSMPLQGEGGKIDEMIRASENSLKELEKDIINCKKELDKLAESKNDFGLLHDFYLIRSEKIKAIGEISGSRSTFWLTGWIPTKLVASVEKKLKNKYMLAIENRQADKNEEHPILLKNPGVVKPYEVVVEMFSAPSVKDIDPSPLLAPFFFFFFGMMLSDVGYGLVLTVLCGLLIWKFKVKGELARMSKMLFISGIGSIIWGFVFGGFFGNMLTTLSDGKINMPSLWFNPMDDPTKLMIWSMIFGVIHLFAGMGARIYMLYRLGKLKDGLLDVAPWYLIIIGLGLMLGGIGGSAGMYTALAGALVLLLFGGREAKNPIMRLLKGLISIYNITSYFSDILSYTRILALVLATSVIGMVVNLLGFLLGPTPGGIILFIVVAILGHSLNLALSALSAYVHTSRLQYVEFFGKFYEGGGRLWKPLQIKTKYTELVRKG